MAKYAGSDPSEAAETVRERVGLGTADAIPDVIAIVEGSLGIPVGVIDMGKGIAGAYVVRRDRPFILVNGRDFKYRQAIYARP